MEGIKLTPTTSEERKKYSKLYGSSVRISRYTYKIVWVKSINDGNISGLCNFQERVIYMATDHEDIENTLIHEIMHGEIEASGLRHAPDFTRNIEEIICELASHAVGTNYVLRKR